MRPIRYVTLPGGYSWVFLVGVWRPVLQILTLFQTKKCHFPHPFLDMEVVTKRNITRLHKTEINVIVAQNKTANVNKNQYPFSDQNGAKALPFGAAHTYVAYIRDYPPPPHSGWLSTLQIGEAQLHSVTNIAPKSRFLCVNQSPIRYGFRAGAKAICCSVNIALRWCYMGRFVTMILSATRRCNIGTLL